MSPKYTAKYEETKEALIAFCEIFHQERCEMTCLIGVGIFCPIILIMMFLTGNPGGGTVGGTLFFLFKFLCVWIAAFFAADILARTLLRRMMFTSAVGDAEELYRIRIKKRSKPLVVNVEFYEDKIVNDTGTKQSVFYYEKVKKLLESEKAVGFLVKDGPGPKTFFAVPKNALEEGKLEELKTYLLEKCTHIKKFKTI